MNLYYTNYYSCRKHIYRERYYQKKEELQREKELFEEYGGKEKFYKDSLIKMGFLNSICCCLCKKGSKKHM